MIELKNVKKVYSFKQYKNIVFEDVNLTLNSNTITVIIGESGSGKSTLLNIVAQIEKDFEGDILFNGIKVNDKSKQELLRSNITYMVQSQSLFNNLTVNKNLSLINNIQDNLLSLILSKFKLIKVYNRVVKKLSGGEKQRLSLIRGLSSKSRIIILDEPTSNLDEANRLHFLQEIDKYKKDRIVIIATHDHELIIKADQVFEIKNKRLLTLKVSKKPQMRLKLFKIKNNNLTVLLNDIFYNKKSNLLFISTLASSIAGLLLGFVIISGFNNFFVNVLNNQVQSNIFLVYPKVGKFDLKELDQFENYLICNNQIGIICDQTLGQAFLRVKIHEEVVFIKLNNSSDIKISKKLHQLIDAELEINVFEQKINLFEAKLVNVDDLYLEYPYKHLTLLALSSYNLDNINSIIVSANELNKHLHNNYVIINPYQEFYKPFEGILKYLGVGLSIYGFVSLVFGGLIIFVLTLLEIDSRKRDIGTLILLGWSENNIKKWFLMLNFLRVMVAFIFQVIMLKISVISINRIFEELTKLQNIFNLPSIFLLIGLIIIIEIIIGILTILVVNKFLKLPPKRLLSNF